jgi:hypothetical protein
MRIYCVYLLYLELRMNPFRIWFNVYEYINVLRMLVNDFTNCAIAGNQ